MKSKRTHKLLSPVNVANTNLGPKAPENEISAPPSITEIRRQIEDQISDQRRREAYGTLALHPTEFKKGKEEAKRSETNAAHRIEFMRKIEEGKTSFDNPNDQSCVFQQLDLNDDLMEQFKQMNLNLSDFGTNAAGNRNPNARRIVIPLTANERGSALDTPMGRNIASEYAARYCEMLNVTPSAKNLAMIQRKIPLKSCTVSQLYNAGQARNNVVIEPSKVNTRFVERNSTDDVVYKLLTAETNLTKTPDPLKNVGGGKVTQNPAFMRTTKKMQLANPQELARFPVFDEYKYRFVFPWNVDDRDVAGDKKMRSGGLFADKGSDTVSPPPNESPLEILDRLLAKGAAISSGGNIPPDPAAQIEPEISFSEQDAINTGIRKELSSTIIPSDATEIQTLLRLFVNGFPWSKLGDRLPPAVMASMQRFIRSPTMVTACLRVCQLMYVGYIRPFSNSVMAMTTMQQEDLFVEIATLLNSNVRCPDGIEHALRLLAIRVVTLAELTSHLPLFATSDIGEGVKKGIDTIIIGIGDPTGLVCRICAFESSPQALRMIRQKRLPKINVLNVRSPLAYLLLKGPEVHPSTDEKENQARHAFALEVAELQKFVSPRIRKQLLEILKCSSL